LRGIARSVAFVTLAQAVESAGESKPLANPTADTLVYYMGRKDAARIAQQLIEHSPNHGVDTPVQILEAVSTSRERQWSSTLSELAAGKADQWFDISSPALIMVGEALRESKVDQSQNAVESKSKAA
jgi:uroporphyrin-III C-methyltransferase